MLSVSAVTSEGSPRHLSLRQVFLAAIVAILLWVVLDGISASGDGARLIVVVDQSELGRAGALGGQVGSIAVDGHGNLFLEDVFVGARPSTIRCRILEHAANGRLRVIAGSLPGQGPRGTAAQHFAIGSCGPLAVGAQHTIYLLGTRFPYGRYPTRLFSINVSTGTVRAVAGCARCFGLHANRPATRSSVEYVADLARGPAGNLLLADAYTSSIWRFTPGGTLHRVATNICRLQGNIRYVCPRSIATAPDGTIYFSDSDERVEALSLSTGRVAIVAGGGSCPGHHASFCGNGIPATKAKLDGPEDIALDPAGDLLIADDVLRRVDRKTHVITILAGNGKLPDPSLRLHRGESVPALTTAIAPRSLAVDRNGDIFIAEDQGVLELPAGN